MAEISRVLADEGGGAPLKALQTRKEFNPAQVGDALDNIRHSLTLDLDQFRPTTLSRRGSLILVGGGPSMADCLPTIRRLAERRNNRVIAFNDALPFLLERNIPVWGSVFMEVAPWHAGFMDEPPEGIVYLMSSACHPETYRKLEGANVIQWHALEGIGEFELIADKFDGAAPLVGGGVTALTRAIFLGHAMGFRRFELFGVDSSHRDGRSHAYYAREQAVADIQCAGKWFQAPGYLARQCEDLINIAKTHHPINIQMRVHGEGMFPHAARELGIHAKGKVK